MQNPQYLHIALILATVLPLAVIAWAILRPRKALLVSALFLECILLVNAGWHISLPASEAATLPESSQRF